VRGGAVSAFAFLFWNTSAQGRLPPFKKPSCSFKIWGSRTFFPFLVSFFGYPFLLVLGLLVLSSDFRTAAVFFSPPRLPEHLMVTLVLFSLLAPFFFLSYLLGFHPFQTFNHPAFVVTSSCFPTLDLGGAFSHPMGPCQSGNFQLVLVRGTFRRVTSTTPPFETCPGCFSFFFFFVC